MKDKDIKHLEWVYERMKDVHNENEDYDYMIRFCEILEALREPAVSSNCGCVISWGVGFYDVKEGKDITHNVTNILIDSFSSMVKVTIQKGKKVYTVDFSMEHAQKIGFINIKALSNYC